jgi:mannosylfructose-phosphate synthase
MTAIEAMACGTPTVITTEGGLCEQVAWGVEALYANPFDPEAYGHAITSVLLHARVSSQLARFGPRKARGCFTWTAVAQQLLLAWEARRAHAHTEQIIAFRPGDISNTEDALWIA